MLREAAKRLHFMAAFGDNSESVKYQDIVVTKFLHRVTQNQLLYTAIYAQINTILSSIICLQCFDAVGWVAGRASGL